MDISGRQMTLLENGLSKLRGTFVRPAGAGLAEWIESWKRELVLKDLRAWGGLFAGFADFLELAVILDLTRLFGGGWMSESCSSSSESGNGFVIGNAAS